MNYGFLMGGRWQKALEIISERRLPDFGHAVRMMAQYGWDQLCH